MLTEDRCRKQCFRSTTRVTSIFQSQPMRQCSGTSSSSGISSSGHEELEFKQKEMPFNLISPDRTVFCNRCRNPINDMAKVAVEYGQMLWHKECFRCTMCNRDLNNESFVQDAAGNVCCPDCELHQEEDKMAYE
ncbi:hypothetical protein ACOME3_003354 [Neoechinorhynchus agilis]